MRSRTLQRVVIVGTAMGLGLGLGGCASNPWADAYKASGSLASPLGKAEPVRVRQVPWERVQGALDELNRDIVSSDVHPEDWSPAQQAEARAKLMRGFQISEDPAGVTILGRSEFRSTSPVSPDDGQLAAFARERGATTVVWASTYLGKADKVVDKPVQEFRSGTATRWDDRDGRWRDRTFSENSTIWVPVVVRADEYAWIAYFLRDAGR